MTCRLGGSSLRQVSYIMTLLGGIIGFAHIGTIAGPLAGRRAHNDALLDWMNRYILDKEPETEII